MPLVLKPGSEASEYTPSASHCQMSTVAPASAVHALLVSDDTLMASVSGAPSFIAPFEGSLRTSARLIFSSTKYGPSVSAGRTMHAGTDVAAPAADVAAPVALVVAVEFAVRDAVAVGGTTFWPAQAA